MSALEWAGAITGTGVLSSVLTKVLGRRKDHADAAKVLAEAAAILILPLSKQIEELSTRVENLERENKLLRGIITWHLPNLQLELDIEQR